MALPTHLDVKDLHLAFGGLKALNGVSLSVGRGELVSLIGPNGAGKTSVINCICRFYPFTEGRITFEDHDISRLRPHEVARRHIARTFQNLDLFKGMTVLENVKLGAHVHVRTGTLANLLYYGPARREEERLEREVAEEILEGLHLTPYRHAAVGSLAYGLQKRVDLARALSARPRLLILDEPMAGMNAEETEEMTEAVLHFRRAWDLSILLVEHDMDVVMNISDRIYVVNFGKNIAEGPPERVAADPEVIRIYLGQGFERVCRSA